MRARRWRRFAIVAASGGILFQAGACAPLLIDIATQQVLSTIVAALIDALLGGAMSP